MKAVWILEYEKSWCEPEICAIYETEELAQAVADRLTAKYAGKSEWYNVVKHEVRDTPTYE